MTEKWTLSISLHSIQKEHSVYLNRSPCWIRRGIVFENSVEPPDQDLHCFSFSLWIDITNNIELSDWLTVRNGCGKLNLFSRTRVKHFSKHTSLKKKTSALCNKQIHFFNSNPIKGGSSFFQGCFLRRWAANISKIELSTRSHIHSSLKIFGSEGIDLSNWSYELYALIWMVKIL